MSERISSYAAFWPYYLTEHANPVNRRLHFVGTSCFLALVVAAFVTNPGRVGAALVGVLFVGALSWRTESRRAAWLAMFLSVLMLVMADGRLAAGVVCAYAFAWVGHFRVEHNRPATFTYPLWSLGSDFRLYGRMLRGQFWSGPITAANAR